MARKEKAITRRDFLRTGSCAAMAGLLGFGLSERSSAQSGPKSRVVLIRNKDVLDAKGQPRSKVLEQMLDEAIGTLLNESDPVSSWKRLAGPSDTVGIKTNVWHHLATPDALETAIRDRLVDAGVKEGNISADDKGILRNPVFEHSTMLINMRPMRTHHWSGLGTLLKNYIMFVPDPWSYHGNACERLGAIWQLPHVAGKTRLNILVMLTPLFHGKGPHHFSRQHIWRYCGLIVSADPVAADATGARIIQAKRNEFFGEQKPISPPPTHIGAADTQFGLGNSRPERTELITLGWEEGLLV